MLQRSNHQSPASLHAFDLHSFVGGLAAFFVEQAVVIYLDLCIVAVEVALVIQLLALLGGLLGHGGRRVGRIH